MGESWIDTETDDNPYANWEKVIRPAFLEDTFKLSVPSARIGLPIEVIVTFPQWRPVYARLNGKDSSVVKDHAKEILACSEDNIAAGGLFLRLGRDGREALERVAQASSDAYPPERDRCFFVYLPESLETDKTAIKNLFDVLMVGPVVPGVSVLDTMKAQSTVPASEPAVDIATSPVVTAIIDTELGIANERFCRLDGDKRVTRIRKFWRQTREDVLTRPGFGLGREFSENVINEMLELSAGDEGAFYALLRSGKFGSVAYVPPTTRASRDTPAERKPLDLFKELFNLMGSISENPRGLTQEGVDALTEARFYSVPSYVLEGDVRPVGHNAGHGTWVADIAGGWPIPQAPGDRPLVMVELPDHVAAETLGSRLQIYVLMAIRRILEWADHWDNGRGTAVRVPVVINISLGNAAGPRDGTGTLEREIDRLVCARRREGVATHVVMAAGNLLRSRLSSRFSLERHESETLDWAVPPGDASPSFLEIRLPSGTSVKLTVTTPAGSPIVVSKGHDLKIDGKIVGRVYVESSGPSKNNDRLVTVALAPTSARNTGVQTAPAGTWTIGFENIGPGKTSDIRADVQRDDTLSGWPRYGVQSRLDHPKARHYDKVTGTLEQPSRDCPITRSGTISAFVTAETCIAVGGANHLLPGDPGPILPTRYTGSGPGGKKGEKPDLSAVTEAGLATPGLLATGYFSGSAAIFSGTSGAAPQYTRALADHLSGGNMPEFIKGRIDQPELLGKVTLQPKPMPGRRPRRHVAG